MEAAHYALNRCVISGIRGIRTLLSTSHHPEYDALIIHGDLFSAEAPNIKKMAFTSNRVSRG